MLPGRIMMQNVGWLSTWPWLADSYADKDYLYEGRLIVWL